MGLPQRVVVVGNSGSGKSTLACELARRLDAEHIELDAIHWLPDWEPIERDAMRRVVSGRTVSERWVVDGNYLSNVGDIVLGRADTCVWLDLPRRVVMPRIIRRTLWRGIRREELWNGNREQIRYWFAPDPDLNIVLWSWSQVEAYREQFFSAMADPANAHLEWVHITSTRQLESWLAEIE
jgi:adenylate kinase family enzyme